MDCRVRQNSACLGLVSWITPLIDAWQVAGMSDSRAAGRLLDAQFANVPVLQWLAALEPPAEAPGFVPKIPRCPCP